MKMNECVSMVDRQTMKGQRGRDIMIRCGCMDGWIYSVRYL